MSQGTTSDAVIDPSTGEQIADIPRTSEGDLDKAVTQAREAFDSWRRTTPADRAAALFALADLVEADRDALGELESRNVGKPLADAPEEVDFCVDNLRFLAGAARLWRRQGGRGVHRRGHVDDST